MSELIYKRIHKQESYGTYGGLGIEINIACDRELSQDERYAISEIGAKIRELVMENTIAIDPKAQQETQQIHDNIMALFSSIVYVEEIPNGYCSQSCCKHLPWYVVTTTVGRIKIGWRKRVIEIDWTDSKIKQSGAELFPDEDVTKSSKGDKDHYIHAWGYEKAKEYINHLLKQISWDTVQSSKVS